MNRNSGQDTIKFYLYFYLRKTYLAQVGCVCVCVCVCVWEREREREREERDGDEYIRKKKDITEYCLPE